jgi:hypothetical protein
VEKFVKFSKIRKVVEASKKPTAEEHEETQWCGWRGKWFLVGSFVVICEGNNSFLIKSTKTNIGNSLELI